ncbi:MAG TPA: hypothetical protein GXZ82_09625 [Firmicutes bacterium]|jgi:uroporphyrinogen decarboxylase|nr:hypothetical protein [Bacillota bacterium]
MSSMSTHERMNRIYSHKEADRAPIIDTPWKATLERWRREGLPEGMDYQEYFDIDKLVAIKVDNSPQYEAKVLEQTEEYTIETTTWGATMRNWRHAGGVPEFLGFTIVDRPTWEAAKTRMQPSPNRINWRQLEKSYAKWRSQGAWIRARLFFGFDVTHSWIIGTERVLLAMAEDPDWLQDIWKTQLDLDLMLLEQILAAGYEFDEIYWPDDMGYKGTQFFSVSMYRDLLKPFHKRAVDWAHARGIKVCLHSCGNVNPFVPEFVEMGIDMLNPLEVKAGMDPLALKAAYGDRIAFHGGLNAVLYSHPEQLWEEMRKVVPIMKTNGGYIIGTDHSVPDDVSLDQFQYFVDLAKALGKY